MGEIASSARSTSGHGTTRRREPSETACSYAGCASRATSVEIQRSGARLSRVARQGRAQRAAQRRLLVCWVRMLRSEVEVLSRGPDRGNPTSMRQGRGPELAGRLQCGWLRCEAPVRAGLKEAIGALWWRTRVKRRKALLGGRAGQRRRCPIPACSDRARIGDVITAKSQHLTSGDLLGSGRLAGRPKDARTMVDGPAEVRGLRSTGRRL